MRLLRCIPLLVVAATLAKADLKPIDGTNTVGFAAISAPDSASTIVAVPFEACLDGGSGMLADLVATNGLTDHVSDPAAADQLIVLTTLNDDLVYYYYWLQAGVGWTAVTTEMKMPDGGSQTLTPPAASAFELARGKGFWIKRVSGSSDEVYVMGQIATANQSTPIAEGLNLVGVGAAEQVSLNAVNWSGAYGGTGNTTSSDKIIVCNSNGTFTRYFYYNPSSPEFPSLAGQWLTSGGQVADVTLTPGQGFWYLRQSGQSDFSFMPDGE